MLGKEDVLLWFKDLESYKRIDVMYELLNMCIPFEIRFLGSCIEEIGKHTYQELRGPSIIANDVERLSKDPSLQTGLADESTRHRAVIYMSVLSARNCSCANWYYRTLFRTTDPIEQVMKVTSKEDTCNVISELLLLYTIGLYHPAFTFEQKTAINKALNSLIVYCNEATALATVRNVSSHNDVIVPVKTSSVMPAGDSLPIQHHPPPPPGLPLPPLIAQNLLVVGAPEVRPFTAHSATPPSPPQSRAISPHPTLRPLLSTGINPPALLPPPPPPSLIPVDVVPCAPPMHLDSNLVPPGPLIAFNSPMEVPPVMKANEEENHFISSDDKPWVNDQLLKQNGLRYNKTSYLTAEQLAKLTLDADNSNSSSNSSRNHSPTDTPPSATPAVTPHGPGRGAIPGNNQSSLPPPTSQPVVVDAKPRVNGLPPAATFIACDPVTQPPFSTTPSFTNFPPPPSPRYFFRAPFTNSFPPLPGNEIIYNYQFYYSSVPHQPRNPNCCNCGGLGHTSVECTAQSVEHITQTPYSLDYESPTIPDNPPEK